MNPNNWLGEYLRNRASERLVAQEEAEARQDLVVRGSSPEEPADRRSPGPPGLDPGPAAPPARRRRHGRDHAAAGSAPASAAGRSATRPTSGSTTPTPPSPRRSPRPPRRPVASRPGAGPARWPEQTWQPQCEIYLYPTARQYAQMTGQPEDSPGFSTMGMNGGRIISRRINLRADHPTLLQAVLPHEITHVILADLFPTQQIPRWADEGLAVLSEPADEQQRRAADLVEPLAANRLFPVDALMSMDYPDNRYWALYYAQSVSLTRFLVEQGTPAQMIQFLQGSQRERLRGRAPAGLQDRRLRRPPGADGSPTPGPEPTPGPPAPAAADGPDLKVR